MVGDAPMSVSSPASPNHALYIVRRTAVLRRLNRNRRILGGLHLRSEIGQHRRDPLVLRRLQEVGVARQSFVGR